MFPIVLRIANVQHAELEGDIMRWLRRVRASELYMWAGALFVIAVVTTVELNRATQTGSGSPVGSFILQLVSTLVGGVIAGTVAYGLNRKTRTDYQKDAAVRMIVKLKLIADDFHSVLKTVDEGLMEANRDLDTNLRMWERVRPLVGLGEPHFIGAEEAAPFLARGQADIANRVLLIAVRHSSFLTIAKEYARLRAEISTLLPPTAVEGKKAITEVPVESRVAFKLKSDELEELVRDMLSNARKDFKEALDLCELIGPAAKKMFNDRDMPSLSAPE